MCLWKSCPKSYSLSVNCQKSKEPNQWKVCLGKVFIPEASRKGTEHGHERSSSNGRTDRTRTIMCEHQPAKRRLPRWGNSTQVMLAPWRYLFYTERYTTFISLYCCLAKFSIQYFTQQSYSALS